MNPFCLLPICVGIFWLLHASLRILGRKEAKYTAWLLLAGLPVMAVAFFLTGMAAEDPNPSRSSSGIAGGGLAEAILFVECVLLWAVVGFAETILLLITSSRRDKSTTKDAVTLDRQ